jgi:hypothetical protein
MPLRSCSGAEGRTNIELDLKRLQKPHASAIQLAASQVFGQGVADRGLRARIRLICEREVGTSNCLKKRGFSAPRKVIFAIN